MQVAINLTPVLTTLIICTFLYAMCKMTRKDSRGREEKAKEKQKEIEVPWFVNSRSGQGSVTPIRSQQEEGLREYVEERVKEKTGK